MLLAIVFIASAGVSHGAYGYPIFRYEASFTYVQGFYYRFPDDKFCTNGDEVPAFYPESVSIDENTGVVNLFTSDCGNWVEPGIFKISTEYEEDENVVDTCDDLYAYMAMYEIANHYYYVEFDSSIFTVNGSNQSPYVVSAYYLTFTPNGLGSMISIGLAKEAQDVEFLCASAIGAEVEIYHEDVYCGFAGKPGYHPPQVVYCDCDLIAGLSKRSAAYDGDTTPVATFTIQINGNALSCCSAPPPPSGGGGGGGGGCSSIGISGSGSCGGDGSGSGTGPCGS